MFACRAHNKPGGMMFIPQEDKPGTILVKWCFGTDIGVSEYQLENSFNQTEWI